MPTWAELAEARTIEMISTVQMSPAKERVNTAPNVLMVFPRFNPNSFWSLKSACELVGARTTVPPLGLITVAAMLPSGWNVRLIDRNAELLQESDLDWADMVMTGGMVPQVID